MPRTWQFQVYRTLGSGPPKDLSPGELAFSEADGQLYIGRSDRTAFVLTGLGMNDASTGAKMAIFQQRLSKGANGGLFLGSQWVTRSLTHAQGSFGEVIDGRIRLPEGNYFFWGWATSLEAGTSRIRLRSLDSDWEIYGASLFSNHYSLPNPIEGFCPLEGAETLELQHYSARVEREPTDTDPSPWRRKNWGFGYRSNLGEDELYASLMFMCVP